VSTVIHLVRHGEVANPGNVRYGQLTGFVLSRKGEAQARTSGARLRQLGIPVAALVSSPLDRALQTATLLQIELGVATIELDDRLIEARSRFDGERRTAPAYPWNWRYLLDPFKPSWAEPFADIGHRMRAAITALSRSHPGQHVVVVSHQSPIWLARHVIAQRRGPPWLSRMRCAHASITSLELDGDRYLGETYWAPTS